MCTVSWRRRARGYDLFFNRDELHTRAPELAPGIDQASGTAFIAPRDGDFGGTWLLVNEHGVTVCLLNDYAAAWRPASASPRFSRGHIVLELGGVRTAGEISGRVAAQPLAHTPPFHLLALAPGEEPLLLHWHGAGLTRRQGEIAPPVLTSSSFATAEVIAARLRQFDRFVPRPEKPQLAELAAFHRQHDPAAGAYSVAMHRPDAATRSITQVTVDRTSVALTYESIFWPHAGGTAPRQYFLPRRAARVSSAA